MEIKILEKVNKKLKEDSQDIQMGLGESYFIELVKFIVREARNTLQAKSEPNHSQEKEIGRFTTKSVSSPNETADSPDTLSTREQIKEELDKDYA